MARLKQYISQRQVVVELDSRKNSLLSQKKAYIEASIGVI